MVANLRRNITRIFVKNINNHHIIAIIKRWHHRENNRWGFVGTIIAYLRHASGGGVATPGWQHLRRYQPGANHNRVPPARCSFHSPPRHNTGERQRCHPLPPWRAERAVPLPHRGGSYCRKGRAERAVPRRGTIVVSPTQLVPEVLAVWGSD